MFIRVKNCLLKVLWESANGKETGYQLLVSNEKILKILEEIHNGKSDTHLGVNETSDKILQIFYWVNS